MYTHKSRGMESNDTCLVSLLTAATMITSEFCPRRFLVESRPMSKMLITSLEKTAVGKGVGVKRGVGVRVGVCVGVIVSVDVIVGPGGRGVTV